MTNVADIVRTGRCIGCGACYCEHIQFEKYVLGFPVPVVDEGCIKCGECLKACTVNPENNEDDDEDG